MESRDDLEFSWREALNDYDGASQQALLSFQVMLDIRDLLIQLTNAPTGQKEEPASDNRADTDADRLTYTRIGGVDFGTDSSGAPWVKAGDSPAVTPALCRMRLNDLEHWINHCRNWLKEESKRRRPKA